jgi:hypothetical protein
MFSMAQLKHPGAMMRSAMPSAGVQARGIM